MCTLCACAVDSIAPADEAIVNGTRELGERAVVGLQNIRRGSLCTGTLIAPRVVLTAKHCVQNANATAPDPPANLVVIFGHDLNRPQSISYVQEIRTTPGAYTDNFGGAIAGVDVAVVLLRNAVTDVMLYPIRRDSSNDAYGQTVTVIGFGQTPGGDSGLKFKATTRIASVSNNVLYSDRAICSGDSGGPMIDSMGRIIGVASFGLREACGSGLNGHNQIDDFVDMIDGAIRDTGGPCTATGAERCDGFDNDCNMMIDETCVPIGGTCTATEECVFGFTCEELPSGSRVCTTACDPLHPAIGCPEGLYCQAANGCDGFCAPGRTDGAAKGDGQSCASDTECASLRCVDPGDGTRRCLSPCRGGNGTCLPSEACSAGNGACGACVNATIVVGTRLLGEPCRATSECCAAGDDACTATCLDDHGAKYCTSPCTADASCPMGFHCRDSACVRGPRESIGGTCVANQDCVERTFCAAQGARSWCTTFCPNGNECPSGLACVEAGGGNTARLCAPSLRLLGESCTTGAECVSGTCSASAGSTGMICTRACSAFVACPSGFVCTRGANGIDTTCAPARGAMTMMPVPPPPGGCAVSVSPRAAGLPVGLFVLLGLVGVVVARRRRDAR